MTLPTFGLRAQSSKREIKSIEDSVNYYITQLSTHRVGESDDYNQPLFDYLIKVLNSQPNTLKESFSTLNNPSKLTIVTSADKRFRIYSWDDMDGGTMRSYSSIIQYKASDGIHAIALYNEAMDNPNNDTPSYFYSNIYTIKTKSGKTVYLALRKAIFSTRDVSTGIQAFTIENNKVQDTIHFFKTRTNSLNSFDCYYVYGYDQKPVIHFSADKKYLYVANIDYETPILNWLVYKFDGYKFVYDHNEK